MAKRMLPLIGLGLALFAGCKTMSGETAGQNLDDSAITPSRFFSSQLQASRLRAGLIQQPKCQSPSQTSSCWTTPFGSPLSRRNPGSHSTSQS